MLWQCFVNPLVSSEFVSFPFLCPLSELKWQNWIDKFENYILLSLLSNSKLNIVDTSLPAGQAKHLYHFIDKQ